jgi:hypothetical protein
MKTFTELFNIKRGYLLQAAQNCEVADGNIITNGNSLPDDLSENFKGVIVTLANEKPEVGSRKNTVKTKLKFNIHLFVDANEDITDPDAVLYAFKEDYRSQFKTFLHKDLPDVEYYDSYIEATHPVRIAKIEVEI